MDLLTTVCVITNNRGIRNCQRKMLLHGTGPASFLSLLLLAIHYYVSQCPKAAAVATTCDPNEGDASCRDSAQDGQLLPDYLIVGAGGSGIQTALFLQKYGHSYTILEKQDIVGSFWTKFPVFEELISVNKWTKDDKQRLLFDWHSMLEAPLRMLDVTNDYFPKGIDWQRYMARVVEEAEINVEFGVDVARIADDGTPCVVLRDGTVRCARYRVFVGTGQREKNEPYLEAMGGIPYSRMTREVAWHKRVCILGNGNAGFEVAQNVYDIADRVILYGKHPARLSSVTKYTGDVRVKFLQGVENFHGKLLDTIWNFEGGRKATGPAVNLNETQVQTVLEMAQAATWLEQYTCDVLVIATGFRSHVPGLHFASRFPPTKDWYASDDSPFVHYIGWLMHEADFRKGAGGFLSGYRYLIRNLVHHVREEDHGVPFPYQTMTKEEVVARVIVRCQESHDLIILQDGVTVRDAIVPNVDGSNTYRYYEGIIIPFHKDLKERDDVIFLYFAWGNGRSVSNVFDTIIRYSDTGNLINLFVHPVIEVNGLTRDIHEDLFMTWDIPPYG